MDLFEPQRLPSSLDLPSAQLIYSSLGGRAMRIFVPAACAAVSVLTFMAAAATEARRDDLKKPLVLASQGSFFVGGETKSVAAPNPNGGSATADVTVNQMYVQYQTPVGGDKHVPVVMVHGCCLSSKTWETTPDGRAGWSEYFVRHDRAVYLADQASRARSGFDATTIMAVKAGAAP